MASSRLDGVQALRGVAALLVVISHAAFSLTEKAGWVDSRFSLIYSLGTLGVTIFFVISGFVMVQSSYGNFGQDGAPWAFFRRRLIRVVPMYWIATAVYAAKLLVTGAWPDSMDVFKSIFFIPYLTANGLMQPVYGLGWTLNYEMYFYTCFALSLALPRILGMSVIMVIMAATVLLGQFMGAESASSAGAVVPYYWSRPIVAYFMFGMLIGLVRQRWGLFLPGVAWMGILRLPFGTLALALTLVLAFSIMAMHWGASLPLSMGLVAVVVVGWAALNASPSGESPVRVGAAVLGDASYSIYLTHSFLLGPLARLYGALGLSWAWIWAYMALSMFGAVLLGVWVFRRIERPLLRRMQNVGAGINDSPASRMRA